MTSPYPREPNIESSGKQEPGGPVPPYEGRQTTGKSPEELREERNLPGHDAGPRDVSQAESEGVGPADPAPAGPHGVGISTSEQGNEQMAGSSEEAHRADRLKVGLTEGPTNIDPESPAMTAGDQGG
jgi:hypothetical protein